MTMPSALLPVIRGLRFTDAQPDRLNLIGDAGWRRLLPLTDRSQLTLPLGVRCREYLPEWVRDRIDGNLANNAIRQERIAKTYHRIASTFSAREIEFAVLKGFSHYPLYCADLRHRPQYDLDLYCPPDQIERAYAELLALGYEPFGRTGRSALDHLPPLILKTGWRAKDDYYDPDIPVTVELHFRFWDRATERFGVSGAERFWERRETRQAGPLMFPALHPADAFSYAAWHLVRHLMRGDARAYHVYELAHFLHNTAQPESLQPEAFWKDWRDARPSPLVETIACRLAVEWFGCSVNPVMREFLNALPADVERWFGMFGLSPLEALEHPNKDELFLHLCLVDGFDDRLQIIKRRLFPRRLNPYIADVHVPAPDLRLRLKRRVAGGAFLVQRTLHHARALTPLVRNGVRWRRALAGLPRPRSGRTLRAEIAPP
jgi:Uncharacterised nucleotidyltransferase